MKRQMLERETAVANMQAEVVRSEQMVRIAEKNALAAAEKAKGEAARVKFEAMSPWAKGDVEAQSIRAVGAAKAEAFRAGVQAMGEQAYTALQLAQTLGENNVKRVPGVAVTGEAGQGALASALVGRMLVPSVKAAPVAVVKNGAPVVEKA